MCGMVLKLEIKVVLIKGGCFGMSDTVHAKAST
jgi:hypothetical protein